MKPTYLKSDKARWRTMYEFMLACGKARNPRSLAIAIVENIRSLCPYDQALVYFFDGNGKVCGQHLVNINERWSSIFLEYYAYTDNHRYSCYADVTEDTYHELGTFISWDEEPSVEFVPDYIRPRGLRYSCGFLLFDTYGRYRTMVCLDRTRDQPFSEADMTNLELAVPQLNNLHRNFYYQTSDINTIKQTMWDAAELTMREAEIANLLCQGVSPGNISKTLHVSPSTTYKHISHIYRKLNVSSQQEMLVRLLGSHSSPSDLLPKIDN